MKKILIIVVILIVIIGLFIQNKQKFTDTNSKDIEQVVVAFGDKLKMVSLLAPKAQLEQAMKENYGSYVSRELIEKWLLNPQEAPGRLTSSPWPEKITNIGVTKITDDTYIVQGTIVENTSDTENVSSYKAVFEVKKINDKWIITSYIKI